MDSLIGSGTMAKLLPISNQKVGATSARDGPKKKHKIQHDSIRNKQGKEMNVTMKALIEESTRVRKLPGPTVVRAMVTAKTGVVGIVGPTVVLSSLSIFVATRTCKVIRGIHR